MPTKWELRDGRVISDKEMTRRRLRTADYYDGKIEHPTLGRVVDGNHELAERIRRMSNEEYVRYFGIASRKIKENKR